MAILIPILGSAVGGAVFGNAAAGWIIGSALGALLFPKGGGEGPRVTDLSVTSSAFGVPRPKSFGTVKVAGNIIWALPVREEVKKEKKGGLFGIGGTTVTSYTYFGTFALALGEGEADRVLRIWANDKLVFDTGSEITETQVDVSDPLSGPAARLVVTTKASTHSKTSIDFEFYPGTETQQVDPLILADKGADALPYKGTTYLVFDDIPLADYGNVIPQIKVEVAYVNAPVFNDTITKTPTNGTPTIEPHSSSIAVDWVRRRMYGSEDNNIMAVDMDTMDEIYSAPIPSYSPLGIAIVGINADTIAVSEKTGAVYAYATTGNTNVILRFDPDTFALTGEYGQKSNSLSHIPPQTPSTPLDGSFTFAIGLMVIPTTGEDMLFSIAQSGRGWGLINAETMRYVGHINSEVVTRATVGEQREEGTDLYYTDNTTIKRVTIDATARYSHLLGGTIGVDLPLSPNITFVDRTVTNLYWDEGDNTLLVEVSITATGLHSYMKIETETWTTVWETATSISTAIHTSIASAGSSHYDGGIGVFGSNLDDATFIDLSTGEIVHSADVPALSGHSRTLVFNAATGEGAVSRGVVGLGKINYFMSGQEGVLLSSIVRYMCNKSGLPDTDLNVSELIDVVAGFSISRTSDARVWIDLLARAYFFEGNESDYVLNFPKKAKASALSVPSVDLLTSSKADFTINTIQEPELPEVVTVSYIDRLTSYEPGNAKSKRIKEPSPSMFSNNIVNVSVPVTLEPIEAKGMSEVLLYSSWIERDNYQWQLPPKYLRLDPTDVIEVNTSMGVFTTRLTKLEFSDRLSIKLAGISHEEALYHSAIGAEGGYVLPQTVPGSNRTTLYMINIPLLAKGYDTNGSGLRMHFAMAGVGQDNWKGALLYKSTSEGGFESPDIGQSTNEATTGITLTALEDFPFPNTLDTTSTLSVSIKTGDSSLFVSRTVLDMYNDTTSWILVGSELIKYSSVVVEANTSLTFTGLIRGRRNTEEHMGSHVIGERVILLEIGEIEAITESLENLGQTLYYKGVGFKELISTTKAITQVSGGEAEKPFSVVQVTEEASGGDSIVTWERRSRFENEAFEDGTGTVEFGETIEQYEIDVLDTTGSLVLETFVVTDAKTLTISAAKKTGYPALMPSSEVAAVLNPGAEDGVVDPWIDDPAISNSRLVASTGDPHTGTYSFRMGSGDLRSNNYQDIELTTAEKDLIIAGGVTLDLDWWALSVINGSGKSNRTGMSIECFDEAGSSLILLADDMRRNGSWTQYFLSLTPPVGTRSIRLRILMDRVSGGVDAGDRHLSNNAETYVDDIVVTVKVAPLTEVNVRIYQMSSLVGRGRQTDQVTITL